MIGVRGLFLSVLVAHVSVSFAGRLKIRLVNGKHHYEGRIELFHEGKWGEVCDNKWDLNGAHVACRMLGFPDADRFTFGDWWGRGRGFSWLDDVVCHGDEYSLQSCAHKDWGVFTCSDDKTAGVICRERDENRVIQPTPTNFSKGIVDLPVRLLGPHDYYQNNSISKGVLQVKVNGQWGFVCNERWTRRNSKVACGMLGYHDAVDGKMSNYISPWHQVHGFIMGNVSCSGVESSLVECNHQGWGPLKCNKGSSVNLVCRRSSEMYKHPKLRLRGSFQLWEGRLEVKSREPNEDLHWGTVCDDHFDLVDANVACRTLGLGTASRVFTNARFGQGIRSIYMDDVHCKGWESSFDQCIYKDRSDCSHYEDVSVRCNAPTLYANKIRLRGGGSEFEGRVEIFNDYTLTWGAVCGEDWGLEEAIVTCRELNLGFSHQAVTGNYFGASNLRVQYSNFRCKMTDPSLSSCKYRSYGVSCKSTKRAGVICIRAVPDLVLNVEELEKNIQIDAIPLSYLKCAYEEGCLAASAKERWKGRDHFVRRLLRFTTRVENRGLAPFRPNVPKSAWKYHACHRHYHSMEVFSTYDLISLQGKKLAAGHKASFCLEDTICDDGVHKVFNCTHRAPQGVSPNCYDVYKWNIDCQWIDVTDLQHGNFYLRVTVNPDRKVPESDYMNNIAKCEIYDYGGYVYASKCHLESCESGYDTHGGNAKGGCCVLPFKYNGQLRYKCMKSNIWGSMWCSTTPDYDRDKQWGFCF